MDTEVKRYFKTAALFSLGIFLVYLVLMCIPWMCSGGVYSPDKYRMGQTESISRYSSDLATAISSIGSDDRTLVIDTSVALAADANVPDNIHVKMAQGGLITLTGAALTLHSFEAPLQQCFAPDPNSSVSFGDGAVENVYPEWWGIDGTDDEVEINYAAGSLSSGGVVKMVGHYITSDSIEMKNNIHFKGSGIGATTITFDGGISTFTKMFYNDDPGIGNDHVTISDITLDGNRSENSAIAGLTGIVFEESEYCHIFNCELTGFTQHCVVFEWDSCDNTVDNCIMEDYGTGAVGFGVVFIRGSCRNTADHCKITSTEENIGICMDDYSTSGDSIDSSHNIISNNIITGTAEAVNIQGCTHNTIIGNIIRNCSDKGIEIKNGDVGDNSRANVESEYNHIADNQIFDGNYDTDEMIYIRGNYNSIENNKLVGGQYGIYVYGTPIVLTMSNNTFIGQTKNALYMDGGQQWDFSNNRVCGLSTTSPAYTDEAVILSSNTGSLKWATIRNNSFHNIGKEAIKIVKGSSLLANLDINNNYISEASQDSASTYYGISLTGSVSNCTVRDTRGRDAADYAALVYVDSDALSETTVYSSTDMRLEYDLSGMALTDTILQDAITAIGADHWTLNISRGTWVIDSNLTFNANTRLKFEEGAVFDIDGADVTINGDIDAGLYQIFDVDANSTVSFGTNPKVEKVYPEWWGASGDNSTQCAPAIQDAIDSLEKGDVWFTAGTYLVNAIITMDSYVNIKGPGSDIVTVYLDINSDTTIFHCDQETDIIISGITIDGNRDNQTQGSWAEGTCGAIILEKTAHTLIKNCRIENCWYGTASPGQGAHDNKFINNYFYNNGTDIDTYGFGNVITGNVSEGCTDACIQIEPTATAGENIDETNPYDPNWVVSDYTQALETVVSNNTLRGLGLADSTYGIVIHNGTVGCTVTGNTIANFGKRGISAYHNYTKALVISNNTIRYIKSDPNASGLPWAATGAGIAIADCLGYTITGNIIEYAYVGIYAINMTRGIIENNVIAFCDTSGICLYSSDHGIVKNNLLYNNDTTQEWSGNSGILLHSSSDIIVGGNHTIEISDPNDGQAYCINVYSTSNSDIHLEENYGYGVTNGVTNIIVSSYEAYISNDMPEKAGVNFLTAMAQNVITIDPNDTTPDVSRGNFFITSINGHATEITDLDNPTDGQILYIVGGSNTNSSTISDSGNFTLSAGWTASSGDTLTLFVRNDNDYVELTRSNN